MTSFLPYARQNIDENDIAAVVDVLRGDWLTTGPAVAAFEAALCEVTTAPYAVACSSGTAALHLAYIAAGVVPGDKVIVPAITFAASANAAKYIGAAPVFADVDPETGLMTPETFSAALEVAGKAAAVVPVHLGGQVCDMPAIAEIARPLGVKIIEDACHAIGGMPDEGAGPVAVGACTYSDAVAFSFHPVKTIAMGEGGAVTTRDEAMAAEIRQLRHHGIRTREDGFLNPGLADTGEDPNLWYYEAVATGFNYRASDIHCALGHSQIKRLSRLVARRAELVSLYMDALAPLAPIVRPLGRRGAGMTAWHLFVALIDFKRAGVSRAKLMVELRDRGIGTQVHYIPLHLMPIFSDDAAGAMMPGAMSYYAQCLSLPLYVGMTDGDVDRVVAALAEIIVG